MSGRRVAAIASLAAAAATLAVAVAVVAGDLLRGLVIVAALAAGLAAGWAGLVRRGAGRVLALGAASVLAAVAIIELLSGDNLLELGVIVIALAGSLTAARVAFAARAQWPGAPSPARAVLFMNPRSGGGKAERFHLAEEAQRRGIEAVTLKPGDDLATLVRDAIARGADALAMAGGDGSQAIVAALAAEHRLPYACIPAGTRNHFALDLGVDRDDVVGALDAFVDGGERVVDLAEVNGRVFVNNVSLGVYAEAVGKDAYREAKLRTLLDTMPEALGAEQKGASVLRWQDSAGSEHRCRTVLLVSNNRYRLASPIGAGSRPRLDEGVLGVVQLEPPGTASGSGRRGLLEVEMPSLTVEADAAVPAGIDGEAVTLEPPLRFGVRPRALHVRIAHRHPGASPSAGVPDSPAGGLRELVRIAAGRRGR
jgi:diacylglycerol kinase family enzyme